MPRYGISVKIDVTKIDKNRLFKGQKGTYLDLTTFIDTEKQDQYNNHGFISQATNKEEQQQKIQTPILGNVKVFWQGPSEQNQGGNQNFNQQPGQNYNQGQNQNFNSPNQGTNNQQIVQDDDLPF